MKWISACCSDAFHILKMEYYIQNLFFFSAYSPAPSQAQFLGGSPTPANLYWSGVAKSQRTTAGLRSPTSPPPGGMGWPSAPCCTISDLTQCMKHTNTHTKRTFHSIKGGVKASESDLGGPDLYVHIS